MLGKSKTQKPAKSTSSTRSLVRTIVHEVLGVAILLLILTTITYFY